MFNIRRLVFQSSYILGRNYVKPSRGKPSGRDLNQKRILIEKSLARDHDRESMFNEVKGLPLQKKLGMLQFAEATENLQEEFKNKVMAKSAFDQYSKMEKKSRNWLKKKIIENKYFQKEQEVNLLTYDAKQQIRYLHGENSEEWTPEKLSKSFPVSVEGVKKLLKSKLHLKTLSEIRRHDIGVIKHWEELDKNKASKIASRYVPSSQGRDLSCETIARLAGVNSNYPVQVFQKREPDEEGEEPMGRFEKLVNNHFNLKDKNKN